MDQGPIPDEINEIIGTEVSELLSRLAKKEEATRISAAVAILGKQDAEAELLLRRTRDLVKVKEIFSKQATLALSLPTHTSLPTVPSHFANERHGLSVIYEDRLFHNRSDAGTFADAIHAIGCERVASLGLRMNYHPLVCDKFQRLQHQRYRIQIERRSEWIIVTHSSTRRKKELLDQIARLLRITIQVSID